MTAAAGGSLRASAAGGIATGRDRFGLVGVTGFEPAAFRSQSGCATKLRYTPSFTRPTARGRQVGLDQRSE